MRPASCTATSCRRISACATACSCSSTTTARDADGCSCGSGAPCGGMQAHASADPVRRQVLAVTASIRATNPALDEAEAGRIARRVVGRYLTADLDSSVMSDSPWSGSQHGGGGHGNMAEHMLEGQGLRSMMPGGGGAGAGAAEGAGAAIEEAAPLALAAL